MRSAEVAEQIDACRQSIYACEEEIQSLKKDMERAEQMEEEVIRRQRKLESGLSDRIRRIDAVENAGGKVRMNSSYTANMREDVAGRKMLGMVEYLAEARRKLMREIEGLYDLLAGARSRLRVLNDDLADLQAQLRHWQDIEREEAQAAAAGYKY